MMMMKGDPWEDPTFQPTSLMPPTAVTAPSTPPFEPPPFPASGSTPVSGSTPIYLLPRFAAAAPSDRGDRPACGLNAAYM